MTAFCACGCLFNVESPGYFRKDCRRRITAAGGFCPRNVRSAAKKRYAIKHSPKINLKNNPKNNPKSANKKKLALRAANLKTVQDDPNLDQTLKMSTGTSASVSVLPAHWTHMTCSLTGSHHSFAESLVYSLASPDSLACLID